MKKTILIIEDNKQDQKLLSDILEVNNYNVHIREKGIDGIEFAIFEIPDLIITDIVLNGLDGIEIIRKLKNDDYTKHIPIIALTALAMPGDIEGIKVSGCDLCITKPIKINSFIKHVQAILET